MKPYCRSCPIRRSDPPVNFWLWVFVALATAATCGIVVIIGQALIP